MEEKTGNVNIIDLEKIFKRLLSKKYLFIKAWVITFFLACLWILPKPRYYEASLSLAPETVGENVGGSLNSLASSFGISLGGGAGVDAIYPMLYPDIMKNNEFIVSLFDIKVKSLDGTIDTDLYTYLDKKQKSAFYVVPYYWAKIKLEQMLHSEKNIPAKNNAGIDPFMLTKRQNVIVSLLKKSIACDIDKKTDVISLTVQAQDPLIAATLVDSVSTRLQDFITNYRTSKARNDVEYYTKLSEDARHEYEIARREYARIADSNTDAVLPSFRTKLEDIENTMQLKFNTYTAVSAQLDAARAKLQEKTPAFTTLVSATVPLLPAGPKRMIFVLGMLILVTMAIGAYQIRDILFTKE